jgi:hypothetical protein
MLRRNPTRIDPYAEEAEMREALLQASQARKNQNKGTEEHAPSISEPVTKTTAAERIGYKPKSS